MATIAIGGSAGVGKTTLAAELSGRMGDCETIHVDDLVPRVEADLGPNFITRDPNVWKRRPEWLRDQLISWTANLHGAIDDAGFVRPSAGLVIEGQGVDPRWTARQRERELRVVYVIEPDADKLHATSMARASGTRFARLPENEQWAVVEMNRLYGLWLRRCAQAAGGPWVTSRPGIRSSTARLSHFGSSRFDGPLGEPSPIDGTSVEISRLVFDARRRSRWDVQR